MSLLGLDKPSTATTDLSFDAFTWMAQDWASSEQTTAVSAATEELVPTLQSSTSASTTQDMLALDDHSISMLFQAPTEDRIASAPAQPSQDVQRLRKRKAESDAENTRLHETLRDIRAKVLQMDDIIEDVLQKSNQLPDELPEKMIELSDKVAWVRQRLS